MSEISELTSDSFDETVQAETPVVVDFWAEWCGPCRAIAPILKEMATEQSGRLRVAKLDVDAHPQIAQRFGVMSIPTLILFSKGEEKTRLTGAYGKDHILREFEPHLA